MKFLALVLLALVSVTTARKIDLEDVIDLEDITAYGYLSKVGLPLAESIRKAEAKASLTRIVGGSLSTLGQFPYQAGLLIQFPQGLGVCGASLISNNRIVTAAHCWNDGVNQASNITVVLGSITLFSGGTRVNTSHVIVHENWNPTFIINDIALGCFSNVTLTDVIAPIALPSDTQLLKTFTGANAVASGFGLTADNAGIGSNQSLSHVNLTVISNLVCTLSFPLLIQSSNICTSGANGRSPCNGDSGGPLALTTDNKTFLGGVTSFGSARGCEAGSPAVFTRITSYVKWIQGRLQTACL